MTVRCVFIVLLLSTTVGSQESALLRSQANLVVVPTLVKDAHSQPIYGLTASDFIIQDNGVPQTVRLDDSAELDPLSIVIAIQTGRRAKREYSRINGITSLISPLLEQPEAQVAIVEFDSHVHLVSGFTQDTTLLKKSSVSCSQGITAALFWTQSAFPLIFSKINSGVAKEYSYW